MLKSFTRQRILLEDNVWVFQTILDANGFPIYNEGEILKVLSKLGEWKQGYAVYSIQLLRLFKNQSRLEIFHWLLTHFI